jgi:hypothetical protein
MTALTSEPTSTSELYERIGYRALASAGLIPYAEFRKALVTLSQSGVAEAQAGEDGSTLWRLTKPS